MLKKHLQSNIINAENSCIQLFFSGFFDEYKVQKTEFIWNTILCYIINLFSVTFDKFNSSLMNKSIDYFPQKNKK